MKATKFLDHHKTWTASIDGPWYDDSNPEGTAATPQEAEDLAWQRLLFLQKEVNEFIARGKPEFETVI